MIRISTFFQSHRFHYSTIVHRTSTDQKPHLIISYLIDSLRFSKQDAISVSSKGNLTRLKSITNSNSLLNIFKNYGLNLTQIREIVSSAPKILNCKADKTVEPKIRVFQEIGLSGSDLVKLIKRNPDVFGFGLHTRIIPGLNLLKQILGTDENVVLFINRSKWLCCTNFFMNRLSANVSLLQNIGLSNERIIKFMLSNPDHLTMHPKVVENKMNYVEEKLGISHDLHSFIHALYVALYISDAEIEKKKELFRSFGWFDSDITLLFRIQPYCLNKSEGNIHERLEFYMKDLGYTPSYLIRCHSFFTFSLKKRVIPRYKMLKILKEKELVNDKPALISIASNSELKFMTFLKRFEKDVPGICEMYLDTVRRVC